MQDKANVRKAVLRKRDAIPPEVRRMKSRLIGDRLESLEEIKNSQILLFFASFRTEVDTMEMIRKSLEQGKRVVLPKVETERRTLLLYEIKDTAELLSGYMGIPEPSVITADRLFGINDVHACVIPGAAFDTSCNRIGYGGGYYDRLLSGLEREIPLVSPAYEEQIVDQVPSRPHDIRVHAVVTDRRIIRCKS